jgi:hypothetical protein
VGSVGESPHDSVAKKAVAMSARSGNIIRWLNMQARACPHLGTRRDSARLREKALDGWTLLQSHGVSHCKKDAAQLEARRMSPEG